MAVMRSPLENIYRESKGWLFARVRRRAASVHEAEDVVSETFVQMAAHRALQEVREPRALLLTIAKRVLFDLWRRRDLERAYLEELAAMPMQVAQSPQDRLAVVQALAAIDEALRGLSPKARQAFLLCQLDDMTYAEVGAAVGVSASMVRQYVAKGTQAMLAANGGSKP